MTLDLPTWSHAEVIVSRGGLTVGVFPSEEHDFVVLAGEAEGHKSVSLHAGADGWTTMVAADAWVALGPRSSGPKGLQIGPYMFDLMHSSSDHTRLSRARRRVTD